MDKIIKWKEGKKRNSIVEKEKGGDGDDADGGGGDGAGRGIQGVSENTIHNKSSPKVMSCFKTQFLVAFQENPPNDLFYLDFCPNLLALVLKL